MAIVNANSTIEEDVATIRLATYGEEMRDAIADGIEKSSQKIDDNLANVNNIDPGIMTNGKYIKRTDGTEGTDVNSACTDYIEITGGLTLIIKNAFLKGNRGIGFYDENKRYIVEAIEYTSEDSIMVRSLNRAKYLRVTAPVNSSPSIRYDGALDKIVEIEERITDTSSEIKNRIVLQSSSVDEYNSGYIKTKGNYFDTVDLTVYSGSSYRHKIIQVQQNDVTIITGTGSSEARLWAFVDNNYKLLSISEDSAEATNKYLTAPSDGYLIVNFVTGNPYSADLIKGIKRASESVYVNYSVKCNLISGYILTPEVGQVIDDFSIVTSSSYRHCIVRVSKGDSVEITGEGASEAKLWTFINISHTVIHISDNNVVANGLVVQAPQDGYFIVNTKNNNGISVSKYTGYTSREQALIGNRFTKIENDISDNNTRLSNEIVLRDTNIDEYDFGYIKTKSNYFDTINLNVVSNSLYRHKVIEVQQNDIVIITGTGASDARLWAFVNNNYKLLSISEDSAEATNKYLVAPSDGYFIINFSAANPYSINLITGIKITSESIYANYSVKCNLIGGYIPIPEVGQIISDFSITIHSSYRHCIVCVGEGDSVEITGEGALEAKLWTFIDNNHTVLYTSGNNVVANGLVVQAPQDGYFIVNTKNNNGISVAKHAGYTNREQALIGNRFTKIENDISDNNTRLTNEIVLRNAGVEEYNSGYIKTKGNYFDTVSLTVYSSSSYRHKIIEVEKNDIAIITGTGASDARLWAFVDKDNKLLIISDDSVTETDKHVIAPADGYLIVNFVASDPYNARIIIGSKFANEVTSLNYSINCELSKGYISIPNVGMVMSDFSITASGSYRHCIVCVSKGDIMKITGEGSVDAKLWTFIDTDYTVLQTSDKYAVAEETLIPIEQNGYFIVNTRNNEGISVIKYTGYTDREISLITKNLPSSMEYTFGGGYIITNGSMDQAIDIHSITTSNSYKHAILNVIAGDIVYITGAASDAARLWCLTDTNCRIITRSAENVSEKNYILRVETDGYCIVNINLNKSRRYSASVIRNTKVEQIFSTMVKDAMKYYLRKNYIIGYANTERPLNFINCYGNNQNVHPKVLYSSSGFGGHEYWMAYTPYPNGNDQYENPCIAYSDDGYTWKNIEENPLAEPSPADITFNSDTHLIMRTDINRLECWYRFCTKNQEPSQESVYRRCSQDGITWSEPELLLQSNSTSNYLSPAGIYDYDRNIYMIWIVGEHTISYYEANSSGKNWTKIRDYSLSFTNDNQMYFPWHIDVIKDSETYIMLVMCKNTTPDSTDWPLFVATSDDNTNYTTPQLIMTGTNGGWDHSLYRSSIVKVDDVYRIYYSGLLPRIAGVRPSKYGLSISESKSLSDFIGAF